MNDFSVHRIIGRGGFGEVRAAIKILPVNKYTQSTKLVTQVTQVTQVSM